MRRSALPSRVNYPCLIAFLHGVCTFLLIAGEYHRVAPQLMPYYLVGKGGSGFLSLALGFYLLRRPATDRVVFLLAANTVFYCLICLWVLPLYEIAYLECAIAMAFVRTERRWIFPSVFGAGLIGILVSYYFQDAWGWRIPEANRTDWIWSIVIIFIVAVFIHQFALRASRREEAKRLRYSLIGRETTRLVHDLKGLLSAPLMLVESLQSDSPQSVEQLRTAITHLGHDLQHVREVLKQLNRLVVVNDERRLVDVSLMWRAAAHILGRRLRTIEVEYPEAKTLKVFSERLHSVFFNLLLNSVEAFEEREVAMPRITIRWSGDDLLYEDNAGGVRLDENQSSSKDLHEGGLGLEIVRTELETMRIGFTMVNLDAGVRVTLNFARS